MRFLLCTLPLILWACQVRSQAPTGNAVAARAQVDVLLTDAIAERAFPGAAIAVGTADTVLWLDGYGTFTYDNNHTPVTPHTSFDLASLTKVVATTTAAMQLYENGQLDLDAPVADLLPAFGQQGKASITVRHLLNHTSGFIPYQPFHTMGFTDREQVIDYILADTLVTAPGITSRYSDFNMITLALVIEAITGMPLDAYASQRIFAPLGMTSTGFRPITGQADTTIVPTEVDTVFRYRLVQGEVHDETAYLLGGTAGHAGLFSTAHDLARFAQMLVRDGLFDDQPFLRPETIRLFTTPVDPEEHTRALGWDTPSPEGYTSAGQHFGAASFGHTGFTGTSMWIDPEAGVFAILLTNRVYPSRANRGIFDVRPAFADLAMEAFRPAAAPAAASTE